jgi:magnesium transporter
MITSRIFMDQTWTDLNCPTKEEIDSLVLAQNISPIVAKDLLTPTPIQYAQEEDKGFYAVLHVPVFKHSHSESNSQEIDFIITNNGVISARYDSIDALHYLAKQIEVDEILNRGENSHIFFRIMEEVYNSVNNELAYMEDWMGEIEKNIFANREHEMVFAISNVSRNFLNFKRIIEPHGNVFEFLREKGREKLGEKFEAETKVLLEQWRRTMRKINSQVDMANEFRETNNSMLSTKQNEIMKQLAVIGSILLPLTIVGQLFGLSVRSFPLMNHPYAFWIVLSLMVIVLLISLVFTKIKKWM